MDPPTVVWNNQIGSVKLGMSQDAVDYFYGPSVHSKVWTLPPFDTPYKNAPAHTETYVYKGHRLWVTYLLKSGNTAKVIETNSPYYRTTTGIGVGTRIPLTRCVPVKGKSYCVRHWRSFSLTSCGGGEVWIGGHGQRQAILSIEHGRVSDITIGDPGVILFCF